MIPSLLFVYLIACNSSKKTAGKSVIVVNEAEYAEGLRLVANSNCLTCHRVQEPLTGPTYMDIAKRYQLTFDNVDKLAKKIINGGNGSWGQVPMIPHPELSKADAKTIVKYILSLKK